MAQRQRQGVCMSNHACLSLPSLAVVHTLFVGTLHLVLGLLVGQLCLLGCRADGEFLLGAGPCCFARPVRVCGHVHAQMSVPPLTLRRRPGQPPAVAAAAWRHIHAPPAGCGGRDDRHKRPGRRRVPGRAAGHRARRQWHRRAVRGWQGCCLRAGSACWLTDCCIIMWLHVQQACMHQPPLPLEHRSL